MSSSAPRLRRRYQPSLLATGSRMIIEEICLKECDLIRYCEPAHTCKTGSTFRQAQEAVIFVVNRYPPTRGLRDTDTLNHRISSKWG